MIIGECFWHLLPWDSGAFAVTASGFVKTGSGDRNTTGSLAFLQPSLTCSNWGLSCVHPSPQILFSGLYLTCSNIFRESQASVPPHPTSWGWQVTCKERGDFLAKPTNPGPHDGCISGTQKRNVALWLLGRGGILLWL